MSENVTVRTNPQYYLYTDPCIPSAGQANHL